MEDGLKIVGVGVDIVDIKRIASMTDDKKIRLARKILSADELRECNYKISSQLLATRFAAKEAVVKAIGTGFRAFSLINITISHDSLGKPYVELEENAQLVAKTMGAHNFLLTISHEKETVVAFCIATN
jgi:holo-[acyl-carrier protein] synthase